MPGRIKTFVYDISNGSFSWQYSLLFALINRNICHGPKGSHWLSVGSQLFQQKQHMPVVVRVTANLIVATGNASRLIFLKYSAISISSLFIRKGGLSGSLARFPAKEERDRLWHAGGW